MHPLIGIIMGSDSDLPTMQGAIDICKEFAIPHEVRIVSAHRTVRRATRLSSPPGLPPVTSFSAPPWCPRGRPLGDALALMVHTALVAYSSCRFLESRPPVP